jgi:hypothetical protein
MEEMAPFESSNIFRIRYEENELILEVEFNNGGIYQYFDVPTQIWNDFKLAESKGIFLNSTIKGFYRFSKI